MKKLFLIIGVIISIAFQSSALKTDVPVTVYRKDHVEKNTTVHRSPMKVPMDVYYDSETRQIEVSGDEEMDAQVYVLDGNGNALGFSTSVNAVLNVPENYSGLVIIRIEGEDWIATGKFTA